jgi:hypothetical protein
VKVYVNLPFHSPTSYHAFPSNQESPSVEYWEIYRIHGNAPRHCPVIHKYYTVPNIVHCVFFTSTTYDTNHCRALDALVDILDQTSFRVNETPQGPRRGR